MPHRLAAAQRAVERIVLRAPRRRAYLGLPSRKTLPVNLARSGRASARDHCSLACAPGRY
jgi:hypothetical protein